MSEGKLISIWTWVGLILLIYGTIIFGSGVYYAIYGGPNVVLGELNAPLWWGGIMLGAGCVFTFVGVRATKQALNSNS